MENIYLEIMIYAIALGGIVFSLLANPCGKC